MPLRKNANTAWMDLAPCTKMQKQSHASPDLNASNPAARAREEGSYARGNRGPISDRTGNRGLRDAGKEFML